MIALRKLLVASVDRMVMEVNVVGREPVDRVMGRRGHTMHCDCSPSASVKVARAVVGSTGWG